MTVNGAPRVSLFATCIIDQFFPQVGVSVVRVLRRLGVEVDFPFGQTCCGQPLYNSGFNREAIPLARRVLDQFEDAQYVVVPSGSCGAMMQVFYLDLFQDDPADRQRAEALASKVYEFSQFLVQVLGVEDVGAALPGPVTYHPSCHLLREMEAREDPLKLLGGVSGIDLKELPQADTCCGFGGSFSVKYPHVSEGMLEDKVATVVESGAATLVSCDMGCLMHIDGALRRQAPNIDCRHLAQVLDTTPED